MRLLQVNNVSARFGGTGACAWSISRALPDWEHGILFARPGPVSPLDQMHYGCRLFRGLGQLSDVIREFAPDVVLFHNTRFTDELARISRERPGAQTVYYLHSRSPYSSAVSRCDVLICVSRYLAELVGLGPSDVLYQPVPRPPLPDKQLERRHLTIGRLCTPSHRKWSADGMLSLYSTLAADHPDALWEFVGCPGPLCRRLLEACQGRARFHQPSWEARSLLWTWDAWLFDCVQPETYGRVLCEAQQAGCLPIVPRRGGFIEQVEHGRTGFLCNSPADYSRAVAALREPPVHALRAAALGAGTGRGSLETWRRGFQTLLGTSGAWSFVSYGEI